MSFLLTVDTEPDWGMHGWTAVREMLPRLLELLDARGVRATFFVVGEALEAAPGALAAIGPEHEIGSHGLTHCVLSDLAPVDVARELVESRERLEDGFQRPVRGVRAPFFRSTPNWVSEVRGAGYSYESSAGRIYPSPVNVRSAHWAPRLDGGVWRLPIGTFRGGYTPFCLTYLRLLPELFRHLVDCKAAMFYLHLHEFLPPETAACLPRRTRFLLRRNAGERAWRLLEEVLDAVEGPFVTCSEFLAASRSGGNAAGTSFSESAT
ncbi:MAG: polysaccharide deacetylase family protein [Kiritimatiellaeota bacterium]|nr:polysaccharide deacetylase family protein [Kiritimatiellota bacterium]